MIGYDIGTRKRIDSGRGSALSFGLTSYWKMDESSAGASPVTRVDSIATGNNLTDNNTVASAAGKINNAAHLVKANSESLSVASNSSLTTGGVNFSWFGWVKPTDLVSTSGIAGKFDTALNGEWVIDILNTGVVRLTIMNGGVAQAVVNGPAITAGTYHLIVITFVNSTKVASISIDNAAFVTGVATLAPVDTAIQFTVGAFVDSSFFNGDVDETGWYKGRALTQTDVALLWNGGAGRTLPL
jgi:Concanavalin A-like lectin/glucanases superfamily